MSAIFVLVRALTYAALFISLVLVIVPARVLSWSGITRPASIGTWQAIGIIILVGGAALALWCILTFAMVGKGTPAPFDPPRRLVVKGPYGFVRNPMYIGAALALGGAAIFFQSWILLGYTALFLLITHLFITLYEEPILRQMFGNEYEAYCHRTHRWLPRFRSARHYHSGAL